MHNESAFPKSVPDAHVLDTTAISQSAVPATELLGAVDIVEAFTALRQELKLQVRSGRETQQALTDGLLRIEQRIASVQSSAAQSSGASDSDNRKMAEAIAEIDESLQRAVQSLSSTLSSSKQPSSLLSRFDEIVATAPWLARKFAAGIFSALRSQLEQAEADAVRQQQAPNTTLQGFELLMSRIRRQMERCEIERIDVLGRPFDAEIMHAIDVIEAPQTPAGHVAEQLRPAYRWRDSLLRCADVRLAQ